MSQGFKIKSVGAKKSSGTGKNPKAVVEIGVIVISNKKETLLSAVGTDEFI